MNYIIPKIGPKAELGEKTVHAATKTLIALYLANQGLETLQHKKVFQKRTKREVGLTISHLQDVERELFDKVFSIDEDNTHRITCTIEDSIEVLQELTFEEVLHFSKIAKEFINQRDQK